MAACNNQQVIVIDNRSGTSGGPYDVDLNTPNTGDATITDTTSGNSFVIPAPVFCALQDCLDKDTSITLIESGGTNGGDLIQIKIDGLTVGTAEFIDGHASGLVKWTLNGVLDPMVFQATPIGTAQRNNLSNISAGYLVYNSDINEYQYFDGSVWKDFSATETVSASNGITKVVADLQLGGTLTSPTSIDLNAQSLSLEGTGVLHLGNPSTKSAYLKVDSATSSITLETNLAPIFKSSIVPSPLAVGMSVLAFGSGASVTITPTLLQFGISDGLNGNRWFMGNTGEGMILDDLYPVDLPDLRRIMTIRRNNDATAVVGMSHSLGFQVENNTLYPTTAEIINEITDATNGAESAKLSIQTIEGGTADDRLVIQAGGIQMPDYGSGAITGTATYLLATDASGNIIEEAIAAAFTQVTDSVSADSGNFTADITRKGGSAPTITNPSPGTYNLSIKAGSEISEIDIDCAPGIELSGGTDLIIEIDNSANSRDRKFTVQIVNKTNGVIANMHNLGVTPIRSISGNITTLTFPDVNGFTNGFEIELR